MSNTIQESILVCEDCLKANGQLHDTGKEVDIAFSVVFDAWLCQECNQTRIKEDITDEKNIIIH